jgi:2-methylisocitrate lyase-like PEP mutase family enzyme
MRTQTEKGTVFRELHQRHRAFIIPNPWDIGTARLLARLGPAPGSRSQSGVAITPSAANE